MAHWHWWAALIDISHWCFLWCGRLRLRSSGLLRSVWEAVGKEAQPWLYCSLILMSSAKSFTWSGWSWCRTLFLWSHCWCAFFKYEAKEVGGPGSCGGWVSVVVIVGSLLEFPCWWEETVCKVLPGQDGLCLSCWGNCQRWVYLSSPCSGLLLSPGLCCVLGGGHGGV